MTTAYAAFDDELLVVRGGPGSWSTTRELAGRAPRCLAADPARPERVFCGTSRAGLWATADAGATWTAGGDGVAGADATAIATAPAAGDGDQPVLYLGTEPSTLHRSDDGGATWRELTAMTALPSQPTWSFPPRPYTSHVRWITPDPHRAGTLFVCIEAGALIRSFDGGETWVDRVPDGPYDTHTLVAHQAVPGRLWSAAGDGFTTAGRGFSVSDDGGDSWRRPDDGLRHHYLWGVALDPADPATVLVSCADSPRSAHDPTAAEATVYRRAGDGPWQEVTAGLPPTAGTNRSVLAANPAEPGVFYAANNRGLYRSADAGASWERLPVEWPAEYQRQSPGALVVTP